MEPLFKPFIPELPQIDEILHSGALSYGEYTKRFESKLKEFFGTDYLIVTNTYHMGIQVALETLGIRNGDEIIASPMACLVSTQPYLSNGLIIRWADIDPQTGTLDPDFTRKCINKKTKAIIHNHFCGYPGYIDEINEICREYEIPVIDDGIECFGSEYKGFKIGNCGSNVTIFSLSAVRICNCIDGGVVIFDNKSDYERSLLARDSGIDRTNFRDSMGEINPNCDINMIGYSATMSNVNGYIGVMQMDCVDALLQKQRQQALKWDEYFHNQKKYSPIGHPNSLPNYWLYGIRAPDKNAAIKEFRSMGYYASGVHIRNDTYSIFGKQDVELKGVDEFCNSFVGLPCGWWIK